MPPKSKELKSTKSDAKTITTSESEEIITPRSVSLKVSLRGSSPGDLNFLALFNGQIVLDGKWSDGMELETEQLALNLKEDYSASLVADKPLIMLLRSAVTGKGPKEADPLLNSDNKIGACVDLFPLLLGEEEVFVNVPLVFIETGGHTGCSVDVEANAGKGFDGRTPLTMTLISVHCLPPVKDGTVYMGAVGLDRVIEPAAVNFGMTSSTATSRKVVWAAASPIGYAAATGSSLPDEDFYVPPDFEPSGSEECITGHWNAMKRILVNPQDLRERLEEPLLIEVAGVPKTGKLEARGRYMGWIDGRVLLEPGQFGATISTSLLFFNEFNLPENMRPVLELPPTSAKASARETDLIIDELGHLAYVKIRFDLPDPLVPKAKISSLFEAMGLPPPEVASCTAYDLHVEPLPDDPAIDVRRIRKECGALAVHKELSTLACKGSVPMTQGIKRTAANKLLMRVRNMLKQFNPMPCSEVELQDTVTAQHAACRKAVAASFAPQPPNLRPPGRLAISRSRVAGDNRIAERHIETNLKIAPRHPRTLMIKALRCLEARNDSEARSLLMDAITSQNRNRFVLWAFGAQEFDKGDEEYEKASAAFRIAVKGDYSDGTANAIGWAALHALYHFGENHSAAFVAAKKMRKSYELPKEWKEFLKRWENTSGEEEILWIPSVISSESPLIIAAAFFLCLRGYKFSARLLQCHVEGCGVRGARLKLRHKITADVSYLKAASYLLRRMVDKALPETDAGIRRYGPCAILCQMKVTCLLCAEGWNGDCEDAFGEAERTGSELNPAILLQAALGGMSSNPKVALQRAARAHKAAPSAHSALVIGRIYEKMDEREFAERWAAAAVKLEPLLSDGWAFLALLALYDRDVDKAQQMLRTAKQAGPVDPEIKDQVKQLISAVQAQALPDALVKNLCLCEYY